METIKFKTRDDNTLEISEPTTDAKLKELEEDFLELLDCTGWGEYKSVLDTSGWDDCKFALGPENNIV